METLKRLLNRHKIVPRTESSDQNAPFLAFEDHKKHTISNGLEEIQIAAARGVSTAQPEPALPFHTHRPAWATFSNDQLQHPSADEKDASRAGWGPMVDTGLNHRGIQACAFSQDQTFFAVGKPPYKPHNEAERLPCTSAASSAYMTVGSCIETPFVLVLFFFQSHAPGLDA